MTFDPKLSVSAGLDHLSEQLDPIITAKFASDLAGHPWTVILEHLDQVAGRAAKDYSTTDLQTQLKMFTRRLGNFGFPFDDHRQTCGTLGRELTIVRNARAHGDPFTPLDAWRAHDYCGRLLEFFADAQGLLKANELRHDALIAYVDEQGIAPVPVAATHPADDQAPQSPAADETQDAAGEDSSAHDDAEVVAPAAEVYLREPSTELEVVGSSRLEFEGWQPVPVGDVSVLDDLPKKAAKEKVRAVAVEIVEFEGPISLDRLAQLTAASFGVQRLWPQREKKLTYQIRRAGQLVNRAGFIWPEDTDPDTWQEFRPNSSHADRPFLQISPVEIANAMRFLRRRHPEMSDDELDAATLNTFGRKRRSKLFAAHLAKARAHLATT